jgi:capsular polysaccharide biosynthesis protein
MHYGQSLEAVGHERCRSFPLEKNVKIRNPVITECPRYFATTSPQLLLEVRQAIISHFNVLGSSGRHIVYVSRSKARGRRVINEEELARRLEKFDVKVIHAEDLTFRQQVELMQHTSLLISIHGAGLANMMFMPLGSKVLELIPKKNVLFDYNLTRNSFKHDPCYLRLADVFSHDYYFMECRPEAGPFSGTHMANVHVDLDRIENLIEKMICSQSGIPQMTRSSSSGVR